MTRTAGSLDIGFHWFTGQGDVRRFHLPTTHTYGGRMNTRRRLALSVLALSLFATGRASAQAAPTEPLKVIRIGVATGGVGSNPIRHGGTTTALAYTDGAFEAAF